MRIDLRNSEQRAGLSALMMVVAILTVGALAKSDIATQLFISLIRAGEERKISRGPECNKLRSPYCLHLRRPIAHRQKCFGSIKQVSAGGAVRGRNAGRRIRESWISAEYDRRRWREIDAPRSKPNKELNEYENLIGERCGQWLVGEIKLRGLPVVRSRSL